MRLRRWVVIATVNGNDMVPKSHDYHFTRFAAAKAMQQDESDARAANIGIYNLHYRVERV
jgi:hypothetical protein